MIPVSLGELVDKISILEIKSEHLSGDQLSNVLREAGALRAALGSLPLELDPSLEYQLKVVNQELWVIEDAIRAKEDAADFGPEFISLARAVYQQNDRRAAIKKQINLLYESTYVEEKSYALPCDLPGHSASGC